MRTIVVAVLGLTLAIGSLRADEKAGIQKDLKKFSGSWTFESVEAGGMKLPAEPFKAMSLVFDGGKYSIKMGDTVGEAATFTIDPSKSPKAMDATVTEGPNKGAVYLCIYEIDGDTLKVCFDPQGKKRPTEFKTAAGSTTTLVVHKRRKK